MRKRFFVFLTAFYLTVAGPAFTQDNSLTTSQLKDMTQHPDDKLLDNLRTHNFAAISDARWSRFNQFALFSQLMHCATPTKEHIYSKKLYDDDNTRHAYQSMENLLAAPYPYGLYYFLKEAPGGSPVIDSNFLITPSLERKKHYADQMGTLNCEDPGVQKLVINLGELYTERTKADAARGGPSQDPPSSR